MYNTVEELHISLDQSLQSINSNRKSIIKPQEKDWLLNETQLRLIDMIMDARKAKGYEDDQLNYDMLLPIKEKIVIPVISIDSKKGYAMLPSDYLHRDSISANVVLNCNEDISAVPTSDIYHKLVLPKSVSAIKYEDFELNINTTTIFKLSDYGYTGFNKEASIFTIISLMIDTLREIGFDIYWEQYNDIYESRTLFIRDISYGMGVLDILTANYDSTDHESVIVNTTRDINSSDDYQVLDEQPTSLVSTEDINDMLKHNFYTTVPDKPLTTLSKHIVIVYYNDNFFVNSLTLRYIRLPRLINSVAGIMTELTNISDKIVQFTVQNIKAKMEDKSYQAVLNENVINN